MCGIVGYIGNKEASPILLKALKKLEYRGYDSCGIATLSNNKITLKKNTGKIEEVEKKEQFGALSGSVGLAHSRWATHGGVTKENAHPHTGCKGKIALVHNGIIENYQELKDMLKKKGHTFVSDTDTEVIAHLIEDHYKDNLKDAVIAALQKVEGSYALGVVSADEPDVLVGARNESPLIVGVGKGENFIASDVPAILAYTKDVIFLDDKEVVVLEKGKYEIFNLENKKVTKKVTKIQWNAEMAEKSGYKHFMLKEIFEQPRAIEETLQGRLKNGDVLIEDDLNLSAADIKKIKRIVIIACGTSWHASLVGEFMIEEYARIPVEVEYASEFRYRNPVIDKDTLVIAISQSGETADTLAAMKEAKKLGAKVIAISNVVGSSVSREAHGTLYTRAGPEIGVASTKAFTSQLVVLYLLTIYLGKSLGVIDSQKAKDMIIHLRRVPLQMQSILDDDKDILALAKKLYQKKNALYLGRGSNYPIALEGALKLKEVSYIHAEGYPAAEMKHGPIALIDKEMPVVVMAVKDISYKKVLGNIEEVKARGGYVIALATKGDEEIKKKVDHVLYLPHTFYSLGPILNVVPLQLLAYHIADLRKCDIDKPRNLAKSVTVE